MSRRPRRQLWRASKTRWQIRSCGRIDFTVIRYLGLARGYSFTHSCGVCKEEGRHPGVSRQTRRLFGRPSSHDLPSSDALCNRHCDSRQHQVLLLLHARFIAVPQPLSTMSVCPPYAPFFGFAGVASSVSPLTAAQT